MAGSIPSRLSAGPSPRSSRSQVLLSSIVLRTHMCPKETEAAFHILLRVIAPRAHPGREKRAVAGPRTHVSVGFVFLRPWEQQLIRNLSTVSKALTL